MPSVEPDDDSAAGDGGPRRPEEPHGRNSKLQEGEQEEEDGQEDNAVDEGATLEELLERKPPGLRKLVKAMEHATKPPPTVRVLKIPPAYVRKQRMLMRLVCGTS